MSSAIPTSDFDAFYAFLSELRTCVSDISPEESVQRFRESQEQLRRFQGHNNIAAEQSRQGLPKPLDLPAMMQRIEQRVARQGSLQ
jgi:hypothetical protein